MALESVFSEKFEIALEFAYTSGRKGAWIQGMGSGLMNGLVYFVEGESSSLPSLFSSSSTDSSLSFPPFQPSSSS